LLDVCPFSGKSKNEDEIGDLLFPDVKKDKFIGKYLKCYAGYVSKGDFREKGSSGGFGKWLAHILLKEREVDFFVQIASNSTSRSDVPLFDYKVYSCADEVIMGSKSSYYPTSLTNVIEHIRSTDGRFAISGVPCFIKSIRLLSLKDPVVAQRVKFAIGIVCGGMKSANQSKMIGWQLGVHPDNLVAIDFRGKDKDKPASHKVYKAWSNKDDLVRCRLDRELIGSDYGAGYFKPNACDFCDDVVGETADISLGDAWLPQYVQDYRGTSIVVVRNRKLLNVIERYRDEGVVCLDEISKDDVIKSQEGGLRHRREGLSYRLATKEKEGLWYPQKRVKANQYRISKRREKIYSLRADLASQSHIVFLKALMDDDFNVFIGGMAELMRKYERAKRGTLLYRGLRKVKKIFKEITRVGDRIKRAFFFLFF